MSLEIFRFLISDITFKNQQSSDRYNILDIVERDKLLPFEQMQAILSLLNQEYFTYAKLSSQVCCNSVPTLTIPKRASSFYSIDTVMTKGVSLFYNLLQFKLIFAKSIPLVKQEQDLTLLTLKEKHLPLAIITYSKCVKRWELSQMIYLRWYLTSYRIGNNLSLMGCGQVHTLLHMLWSCLHVRSFWNMMLWLIS